jgi:hypothetical protein
MNDANTTLIAESRRDQNSKNTTGHKRIVFSWWRSTARVVLSSRYNQMYTCKYFNGAKRAQTAALAGPAGVPLSEAGSLQPTSLPSRPLARDQSQNPVARRANPGLRRQRQRLALTAFRVFSA